MQKSLAQLLVRGTSVCTPPVSLTLGDEAAHALADLWQMPSATVRCMMNQSLDGSVTGADGTSASLSNEWDFLSLTVLRALADVIVMGAETARLEQGRRPSGRASIRERTLRPAGQEFPALAIVTRSGHLPQGIDPLWPTYLLTPASDVARVLKQSGFPASHVLPAENAREMVKLLHERGLVGIQVEGGPSVNSLFLAEAMVDELVWTRSAVTVGGKGPRAVTGLEHMSHWQLSDLVYAPDAIIERYARSAVSEMGAMK